MPARVALEDIGWSHAVYTRRMHQTGPPELRGFARNLRRDWDAVHAGLTERWKFGPRGRERKHS